MARPSRFQYPGAIEHVMARGDGEKNVFETNGDRKSLLHRLGQFCTSHCWRVHGCVLMGNHFHLLLDTPQANLGPLKKDERPNFEGAGKKPGMFHGGVSHRPF
jgi:putative transposase